MARGWRARPTARWHAQHVLLAAALCAAGVVQHLGPPARHQPMLVVAAAAAASNATVKTRVGTIDATAFFTDPRRTCPEHAPTTIRLPRSAAKSDTFRFIHIPKTGGTTLNTLLDTASILAGQRFCEVPTKYMYSRHSSLLYERCQIVSGEFDASVRFAFQGGETAAGATYDFTILRDPVKRAISQYEHHRAKGRFSGEWDADFLHVMHPEDCAGNAAKFCRRLDDPSKCLGGGWCGVFQNHETEVIAGGRLFVPALRERLHESEDVLLCAAKKQLQSMAFVMVTEHYNASVCLMFHMYNWRGLYRDCCAKGIREGLQCEYLHDKLSANVRDYRSRSKMAPKTSSHYAERYLARPDLMAAVAARNRVDCELYKFGLGLFFAQLRDLEHTTGHSFDAVVLQQRAPKPACDTF